MAVTTSCSPTADCTRGSTTSSSWPRPEQNLRPSDAPEDPRATLAELAEQIEALLGRRLLGLYLFGSLAAGGFHAGKSDLDLVAVVDRDISDGAELDELRSLHERFENEHQEWRDRIEVLYVSRDVLGTFAGAPTGTVARISPGERMHLRELEGNIGWLLDWYGVVSGGETLYGLSPRELGPEVGAERFRAAVIAQLGELRDTSRGHDVAYVPAQQGYIVATVCRGLYSIATGEQASKESAVAWYAERHPDEADFVWSAYKAYRADVRGPHERLIRFVDAARDTWTTVQGGCVGRPAEAARMCE